ncbi:hypothetical protein K3495_g4748 [Podosphaera aphanis]|nr:hypothetical protein K3495_g4748 [Podosphaera aphanis]
MREDTEDAETEITAGQKMMSAMSGSLLTSLLVTPLDVVRVRLQSQPQPHSTTHNRPSQPFGGSQLGRDVSNCCREVFFANNNVGYCTAGLKATELSQPFQKSGCVFEDLQKKSFNSTFDGLRKIARHEGITTLWRGLSPTLVMSVPANIIYFTGYEWLRFDSLSPLNRFLSDNWSPLVAGSTARIVAGTVVSPIEMFRTRMQARRSNGGNHFLDTTKGIQKMIANDGYTSLWRGLSLTLWRDVPFSGIYWWGYETIREKLKSSRNMKEDISTGKGTRSQPNNRSQSNEKHIATFIDSFIAGATSGAVAAFITMPFDVGKTRRQVFTRPKSSLSGLAPEEQAMPKFLWHIFRQEGFTGLWTGWIPRTLKIAPACAIMISCYEVGKRIFRSLNEGIQEGE